MDIHSYAVTERVTEVSLVIGVYDVAGNLVRIAAENTLADEIYSRGLCAQDGIVNLFHFFVSFADGNGARHIGAVAVQNATEVHREKSALKLYVSRNTVRTAGLCARNGNGFKAGCLRTEAFHAVFYLRCNLLLGHIVIQQRKNLGKGSVCQVLCRADGGKLLFRLIFAQAFDEVAGGNEFHSLKKALISRKCCDSELSVLKGNRLYALIGDNLFDIGDNGNLGELCRASANLFFSRLDISRVGEKSSTVSCYENGAVGSGKTTEIHSCFLICHNQSVGYIKKTLSYSFNIIHNKPP